VTELDYATVNRYWNAAKPSILSPYMMDGFGFPASAGRFRFRAESKIVQRLIGGTNTNGTVLDLGSGMGYWAEFFSRQFANVVAIEASSPLFDDLSRRCAPYPNVKTIHARVSEFEPEGVYSLMFFGGMLMYLKKEDVISLLRRLIPFLEAGGMILCRETTVREETVTRQGEYQAVYRSVASYSRIFEECGLTVSTTEMNVPYTLLQIGCESVRKWKEMMPKPLQLTPVVGRLAYWSVRLTGPLALRLPVALGLQIPRLTNHFFVLRAAV
jgi:trans-aconitate methyltransferase